MQSKRTNRSTYRVLLNGRTVGYLTNYMVEQGYDITLDLMGYTIDAL